MEVNCPLLALAIGTFGIGTTEFSSVGLLPVIARGVDVSIPAAGMLISTYAAGIMVDAPLMTLLLPHRARRSASIFLMAIFALGNVLPAIASDYMTLMFSRILTSLSHGAFSSLGSVMVVSVVSEHEQASAVVTMFMELTLANIGGVPAATWSGETTGWRMSFLATAGLGATPMVSLFPSLPKGGAGARPEVKKELAILIHPQVPFTLLTTVLDAGAMFTFHTHISPVLQSITHATSVFVTAMLALIGVGLFIGNYLGGKLVDCPVNGTLKGFLLLPMVIMLAIPLLACNELGATISMVMWGAATFTIVPPLQMRVICITSEAPGLSLSVNIGAFNLGNALGAAAGGAVTSAGLGYGFVPVMGVIAAGLVLLLVFTSARKQPEAVCVASS